MRDYDGGFDPGATDARRAAKLRALADRVETALDDTLRVARSEQWACANADDVRGRLTSYQGTARAAARNLREEALSADNDARRKRTAAAAVGAH
ncbi:hypothetical protein [Cellulomonas sp. URHE0023]|uniref:hypothetical protein n=1 Tax=Cellulomonas sp. URHE0023 TaxID=1380354 RepID=UPI000487E8B5|nr:hypothetical protein [Cellulomonas sp. URHE0023]